MCKAKLSKAKQSSAKQSSAKQSKESKAQLSKAKQSSAQQSKAKFSSAKQTTVFFLSFFISTVQHCRNKLPAVERATRTPHAACGLRAQGLAPQHQSETGLPPTRTPISQSDPRGLALPFLRRGRFFVIYGGSAATGAAVTAGTVGADVRSCAAGSAASAAGCATPLGSVRVAAS